MIAASAIYIAAAFMDYPLPNLEWWKIFGVKFEDMEYVMADILNLYQQPKINGDSVEAIVKSLLIKKAPVNKEDEEEEKEKE